ncbi:MAG: SufS family cysteine desulfurase [Alphaproteobacteria bacterium]|nr:SufS family cysteine desulfurase [Alphaproteobacteria bacterium]
MTFDVARVRAESPILARQVHGRPLHYLDNAATTQMPLAVMDRIAQHERFSRANVLRGVHTLAEEATEAYEQARAAAARYVNAGDPAEIVFTGGTTAALNLVAHSFGALLQPGDEIVLSLLEHHSNIVPWQLLAERRGVVLRYLPLTDDGRIDVDALPRLVGPRTRLLALAHVSNVTGAELDVGRVVDAARAVKARVLLDGAQRVAHGPLDVRAMGVDFYVFSGHKMFAPNGIGVLWGRQEVLADMPPFLGGGSMIRTVTTTGTTYADPPARFEAGTPPIAQAIALAAAMEWIGRLDHCAVEEHLHRLTARLLDGLGQIDRQRVRLIGPSGLQARFPIVSFDVRGAHPHDLCALLDRDGVALRGGHHCAQPLGNHFGLLGTTRASLAVYNDAGDVEAFLGRLARAITKLT